jgi:acetyl esterase
VAAPRRETLDDLVESRPFWDAIADLSDLPEGVEVHEDVLVWDRGERRVTAEIYVPEGTGPFPIVVHLHGGGYCVSRARNDRKFGMRLAARGYTVVNPDYGLAPEYPFPAAVEDCLYTARWIVGSAASYRADPERVVLEGASAGAGLAAALAVADGGFDDELEQGDLAGVRLDPVALLLFFGLFSFPLLLLEPGTNVGSAELWNRAYLGPHFTTVIRHPLASPVYAPGLDRFPPTYISCGDRDSLLGHSLAFAKELASAGAPTTVSVVAGLDHGFAKMWRNDAAQAEVCRALDWLGARVDESRHPPDKEAR